MKDKITAADVSCSDGTRLFVCTWKADIMNKREVDKKSADKILMAELTKAYAGWQRATGKPPEGIPKEPWLPVHLHDRVRLLIPKVDGTTKSRMQECHARSRFVGDYDGLVAWMEVRFESGRKKEAIGNPNAYATRILGELLKEDSGGGDGWDFFGEAS